MGKLAVLELHGDLEQQALQVKLRIDWEGAAALAGSTGRLPENPQLVTCLTQWQQAYRSLVMPSRIVPKRVSYGRTGQQLITQQLATQLLNCMEEWLAAATFRPIETKLRTMLAPAESIRILIQTDNYLLRRLPWHAWFVIDDYLQAEIAFSPLEFQHVHTHGRRFRETVQILSILGHSEGINLTRDRRFLEQLPHAEVTFLIEPKRKTINDYLYNHAWDILFFAGHSVTEGEQGRIYCNPDTPISLQELNYGLKKAINQGLQIAIFNSCDGLGLSSALENLHCPQLIVMREPTPDWVAQEFLKQFLQSFTTGQSLYCSMREARERLQGLQDHFPCASWLPVLCQNPAVTPPRWPALGQPMPLRRRLSVGRYISRYMTPTVRVNPD